MYVRRAEMNAICGVVGRDVVSRYDAITGTAVVVMRGSLRRFLARWLRTHSAAEFAPSMLWRCGYVLGRVS